MKELVVYLFWGGAELSEEKEGRKEKGVVLRCGDPKDWNGRQENEMKEFGVYLCWREVKL